MTPLTLALVGIGLIVLGSILSLVYRRRSNRVYGEIVTNYEMQRRRGTVIPPYVSFFVVAGWVCLLGGLGWLVYNAAA